MKRFHCLFAKDDALHAYATRIHELRFTLLKTYPITSLRIGEVRCAVLDRVENYQTEAICFEPGEEIPPHVHPGVDSIDILIEGDIEISVNGIQVAAGYTPRRRAKFLAGKGIRIAQDAPHSAVVGNKGALFLSCQQWDTAPQHIGLRWNGDVESDAHARMLQSMQALTRWAAA